MAVAAFYRLVSLSGARVARLGKKTNRPKTNRKTHILCQLRNLNPERPQTTRLPVLSCSVGQVSISSPWREGEDRITAFAFRVSIKLLLPSVSLQTQTCTKTTLPLLSYGRLKGAELGCARNLTELVNNVCAKKTGNNFFLTLTLYEAEMYFFLLSYCKL